MLIECCVNKCENQMRYNKWKWFYKKIKMLYWNPSGTLGFRGHESPVSLHGPAINFSLLKKRKNLETLVLIDQVCKLLLFLRYRQREHPVQFSSVAQSCLTLCDPLDCNTPRLPVHHQLPELAQTHVHRVSDVIEPSHTLSSPSPPAPNPSQHQGFFQ